MKKSICAFLVLSVLLVSCGEQKNKDTRFLLDTVVTLTAECDNETLEGAFSLCEDLESLLSRTVETSEVSRLNAGETLTASEHTRKIIERSLYYSDLTSGKFDITICSVSSLWNFNEEIIPEKNEIAEALRSVDYESILFGETKVRLDGSKIDLGGIAKGYIADEITEYFKQKGVENGIVNLGGNIKVFGKEYTIGIKSPFETEDVIAKIKLSDMSAVTSGIYERSFEKEGRLYHHILDTKTGYPIENSLASVTVIGESSLDCDALSTVCMVLGVDDAVDFINNQTECEAVLIEKDGTIILSKGLYMEKNEIFFK